MNIFAFIQKSNKFIYLIRETIAKLHTLLRTAKEVISWTLQNKYVLLVHTVTATANAKCSTKINPNAHLWFVISLLSFVDHVHILFFDN